MREATFKLYHPHKTSNKGHWKTIDYLSTIPLMSVQTLSCPDSVVIPYACTMY